MCMHMHSYVACRSVIADVRAPRRKHNSAIPEQSAGSHEPTPLCILLARLLAAPAPTHPMTTPPARVGHSPPSSLSTLYWQRKRLEATPAVQSALDRCTEDDVPILKLLRSACPAGMHGYGCDTRWDVHDSFLPRPRRWLKQFNTSRVRAAASAGVDCQRAFFDAFGAQLIAAHWEQEWDAQPFRISATPPRTIGKMLHQIITANYYHLTLGPEARPPLRRDPAPGHGSKPLPQPGFRWLGQLVQLRARPPAVAPPSPA